MSTLAADSFFDFTFPPCDPASPPSFTFDPSLLEMPFNPQPSHSYTHSHGQGHARSSSHGSVHSIESSPSDSFMSTHTATTRHTTPARSPVRTHGPLLLPKIRSQDQAIAPSAAPTQPAPKRMRTSPAPTPVRRSSSATPFRAAAHHRSFTNPNVNFSSALTFPSQLADDAASGNNALLFSPVNFAQEPQEDVSVQSHSRRASSCSLDNSTLEKYSFPTYRTMPTYAGASTPAPMMQDNSYMYQTFAPRASSPLAHTSASCTPEPVQTTNLLSYLTTSNPAPSLVRTISFPLRDPHTKHFWWDIRQIRPWATFTSSTILSLPSARHLLTAPIPTPLLPTPTPSARHPETEPALHAIYASHYLPKLNAALALSSSNPLSLSVPTTTSGPLGTATAAAADSCLFVAQPANAPASAAQIFGGKPTARVVGLVRSFDRFNTGMRVEGNVKRVEYLRGLAALHHAMREHGCRYGFILTEIELVVVRNGAEGTPHFGYLEVASVQLAATSSAVAEDGTEVEPEMTACLALWGLCMLASDEVVSAGIGHPSWKAEIGAPAEGSRRKALPRDSWMPQPQLAEKREAKRARGWVWPEDAVGRKELGKRGVRYGGC